MKRPPPVNHAFDANLDGDTDRQRFFEDNREAVATQFFRDKKLFGQLAEEVMPRLMSTGLRQRKVLRCWSAGCSDGRETYSLAIFLRDYLDGQGYQRLKLQIRGSDISRPQLEVARRGAYAINGREQEWVGKYAGYFSSRGGGRFQVSEQVGTLVDFVEEDISQVEPKHRYDIVVCSLVLLYYDSSYQRKITRHLLSQAREEGFIYLMPVSRHWMKTQGYGELVNGGSFFYRQDGAAA